MKRILAALACGLIFGFGILLSGMANPAKVLNFLDVAAISTGTWDASLALVMGAALAVASVGYRLAFRRSRPLLDVSFHLPTRRDVDPPLLAGAAIFGIGWGIAGFCPGGALPALGLGLTGPFVFVAAMLLGLAVARLLRRRSLNLLLPPTDRSRVS